MTKRKTDFTDMSHGEGEIFRDGEDMYIACCDCHLVHRIRAAINVDGKIIVRQWREGRITGQLRRRKGIPINET